MNLRPLGRTGLQVSEVVFGGYPVRDPEVVRAAIDRGITTFDTAYCYTRGASEEAIGRGIEGRRDRVVLVTKWHPWRRTRAAAMLAELDTSLRRLRTDHVDVLLVHQVGRNSGGEGTERLDNPELQEAMEAARRAGKARHFGCSGHDTDLEEVLEHARAVPGFSVVLSRYDPAVFPRQPELLARLREAGFGLFVMKVLSGARRADLARFRALPEPTGTLRAAPAPAATSKQAALRWALANPDLSGVTISMGSRDQVEEYVRAVASPGDLP